MLVMQIVGILSVTWQHGIESAEHQRALPERAPNTQVSVSQRGFEA
jgi:hypothetical protein